MTDPLHRELDDATATAVSNHISETLSGARDDQEHLTILKAYIGAALFGYAEITSLETAADWLRKAADAVDCLAARKRGELS